MSKQNHDKIMEQSLYDFLCFMNANIRTDTNNITGMCVMNALRDEKMYDRCIKHDACCDKCIANYLNDYSF